MRLNVQPTAVIVGVACLLAHAPAGAQSTIAPPTGSSQQETLNASERRSAVNGALARLADPTLRSVSSGPTPTLILEASSTAKTAGARIGFQYRDWLLDVKLQGVVDSDRRQAVFADLDGLRHKSTAEFGVLWTRYPRHVASERLDAACREYEKTARMPLRPGLCSIFALRREASGESPTGSDPDRSRVVDEVTRRLDPRRLFLAGASYTFGPEEFSFAPSPLAAGTTQTRVNWAVSARAGLVVNATFMAGAEYLRGAEYGAGDTRQICVPIRDSDAFECSEKIVGGPSKRRSHLVTLEVRKLAGSTFGVNPRLSVNPSSRGVRVEMPLYFLRNGKGGLAGGVTIGWRHSPREGSAVEIAAFAGQVFEIILK